MYTVFVHISDNGVTPTAGQSYALSCSVSGASAITYQWKKDGSVLPETEPTITFSTLRLSDSGEYTCEVTVDSELYRDKVELILQSNYS